MLDNNIKKNLWILLNFNNNHWKLIFYNQGFDILNNLDGTLHNKLKNIDIDINNKSAKKNNVVLESNNDFNIINNINN